MCTNSFDPCSRLVHSLSVLCHWYGAQLGLRSSKLSSFSILHINFITSRPNMSHPLLSICASCRLRLSKEPTAFHRVSAGLAQTRGKKKNARPSGTIEVRLLQDLSGYGAKGIKDH